MHPAPTLDSKALDHTVNGFLDRAVEIVVLHTKHLGGLGTVVKLAAALISFLREASASPLGYVLRSGKCLAKLYSC
jgi:hypothetical protein